MTVKRNLSGKAASMPSGIVIGVAVGFAAAMIGAAILAWLVVSESIPQAGIGYGAIIVLVVASALGAWSSAALIKRRRLMVCGLTAAGFYLLLLAITVFCFGGEFTGMGTAAISVLIGAGSALLPGLRKKSGGRKYKIPAYR